MSTCSSAIVLDMSLVHLVQDGLSYVKAYAATEAKCRSCTLGSKIFVSLIAYQKLIRTTESVYTIWGL